MSTQTRAGIRAARTLLSLLEENSSEDFEAAESILGGEKELATILQLLRKYKEHGEPPLSVERLRDIVRRELVGLRISLPDMASIVHSVFGEIPRTPQGTTTEGLIDRVLQLIEKQNGSPSAQVDALTSLLIAGFLQAEPESMARVEPLLRDLAIRALTENIAMFPTLHALAQLRTQWADRPLHYQPQESRRHLAERLLFDAEHLHSEVFSVIARDLLREGMRGPADGAIAAVRRMKPRKTHGE